MRGKRGPIAIAVAAAAVLMALPAAQLAAQQTGTVEGRVLDGTTAQPLPAVQVRIEGTALGAATGEDGAFRILNVPVGPRTVTARQLGREPARQEITVLPNETVQVTMRLQPAAVRIAEVVVTGTVGEVERTKLPFTVDKLTMEDMPVPAVSAGGAIQGKVAGAQVISASGRPGTPPSILLRGPTSINAQGRDQEPMYIVDGVILGAGIQDIDALDIESIEVVKGAAAASLYGSRAGNGVIQIITRSGLGVPERARFSLRSEVGGSQLPGSIEIAQNHRYRLNAAGSAFVTSGGQEFDWTQQAINASNAGSRTHPSVLFPVADGTGAWDTFQDKRWPGGTVDHISTVFDPGLFTQTQFSVEGRSGQTNYHASFANLNEAGVLHGQSGFNRNSFRLNVDQGLRDAVQLSLRTFYSRSTQDVPSELGGGPFFTLTRMPAGVDLRTRDDSGRLIMWADHTGENANPLYELENLDRSDMRERFLGGLNLQYSPLHWLSTDANISYDRSNVDRESFWFRGFRTARESAVNLGQYWKDSWFNEALNASLTGTVHWSVGGLNARTQGRYLYEANNFDYQFGQGTDLVVAGVKALDAANPERLIVSSGLERVRSEGFFLISNFDLFDRYIVDALVRRDGSSLFGPEERWQTYYRGALAWRVSEEPFWAGLSNSIPEFKLRYSLGTAGGRPRFNAQYETYVVSGGIIEPQTLGNTELKPEFVIEQEAGIDLTAFRDVLFTVTYAHSNARDQLLLVPQLAATGFPWRWENAGTLESRTWELSVDVPVVQRPTVTWTSRVLFDRTRQQITRLNVPDFKYGINQQGLENAFFAREGEALGTFYGFRFARTCGDLPSGLPCNEFQVNDDGYLVWVGQGNSWRDGIANNLWGTSGPVIRGAPTMWGAPIVAQDADGNTEFALGRTTPDFSWSLANTVTWRGFSFYGLIDAVQGVQVYNLPRHWAYFEHYHRDQDQAGKPDELKKPIGYYNPGLYRQLGPPNERFVEDGSYVKLRELAVRYRFGPERLGGVPLVGGLDGLGVSLVGRNLFTLTNYTGFDPEVGKAGGDVGAAAIARFDGFNYPNFRTLTFGIDLTF